MMNGKVVRVVLALVLVGVVRYMATLWFSTSLPVGDWKRIDSRGEEQGFLSIRSDGTFEQRLSSEGVTLVTHGSYLIRSADQQLTFSGALDLIHSRRCDRSIARVAQTAS